MDLNNAQELIDEIKRLALNVIEIDPDLKEVLLEEISQLGVNNENNNVVMPILNFSASTFTIEIDRYRIRIQDTNNGQFFQFSHPAGARQYSNRIVKDLHKATIGNLILEANNRGRFIPCNTIDVCLEFSDEKFLADFVMQILAQGYQ